MPDLKIEVPDLKTEVPDLRPGGTRLNLTTAGMGELVLLFCCWMGCWVIGRMGELVDGLMGG